jgi:tripartite-type tricarboxylate transporter receptor subunit TctC
MPSGDLMPNTASSDTKNNTPPIGRRGFHLLTAGAAATLIATGRARAARYPTRPIRVIVPFAPGGATDLVARELGKKLGDLLHQNVIVENHGGGDTIIGTSLVAQARPDGYTVLLTSNTFAINPTLRPNMPYNTLKDFTPVAICAVHPFVLVVHPSVPAETLQQLIDYAKANPGKLNFATAGVGTGNDLATELFMIKAGVKLTQVPYQSTGSSIPDLLSGRVQMEIGPVSLMAPYVKTGALRALGVGGNKPVPVLPNVPTIAEAGVPGYLADEWNGFVVRVGTPMSIVDTLSADLAKVVQDPDVVKAFAAAGAEPMRTTPPQAKQFIDAEIVKWHDVITKAGIKLKQAS